MSEVHPLSSPHDSPEGPLTLAIVDQTHTAREHARDEADARLVEELNQGSKIRRFANNLWKGSVAYDYYRQKYIREAEHEITDEQNVLAHETDAARSEQAHLATIRRFQSEYNETVHTAAGERREELAADSEVADALRGIIRRYVNGELDDETLREEKTRAIAAFRETHGNELLGQGRVSIDNTLAIAQAVKGAVEHGESLDRVLEGMKVVSGEARSGVRTEAKLGYNRVDRIIDKVNGSRVGSFVQPETVVSAVTIAASIARFGSRSVSKKAAVIAGGVGLAVVAAPVVATAAVMTAVPAVMAGAWAGARENRRMKDERGQHMREMAQGKEFNPVDTRRQEMERTRYQAAAAGDLVADLHARFSPETFETNDALQSALDQLSDIEARVYLSDSRNIDLISYSAPEAVEEERWALDLARAQAKTMLNHRLDPDVRRALGLDETATLDDILRERSEMFADYTDDIAAKDDAFNHIKSRAVRHAMVKGAILGAVLGVAAQEGLAAVSDTRTGLVEELWHAHNQPFDGMEHQTLLHGVIHGDHISHDTVTTTEHPLTGTHPVTHIEHHVETGVTHHGPSGSYEGYDVGDNGTISISSDHSIQINHDGTISILDPSGKVTIDHLPINPDGTLPQESIDILHDNGMTVENLSYSVDNPTTDIQTVSLHEYMTNHEDSTLHVCRDLYYFNDTPPSADGWPNSDYNELGLGWGGDHGTGVVHGGGYEMSVASMTSNGSFENGMSVNWQEAASTGHLKLLITPSGDMQAQPIVVPVNPDGTIDIAPGSPAAEFFSVDENGHAVINASFVEVAQTTDVDANGVTHVNILATATGTGNVTEVNDSVTVHHIEAHPVYKITTDGYDESTQTVVSTPVTEQVPITGSVTEEVHTTVADPVFTEMAPVIPVVTRRPLETVHRGPERTRITGDYYGRGQVSFEEMRRREEISPRLRKDAEAVLNPHEELRWYRSLVEKKRGKAYVDSIDSTIAASPELSSLPSGLKSIITIPVNAAGKVESENIYGLLRAYARQDRDAVSHNAMLLHVNWFDDAFTDPAKKALIDHTKAEIERARRDFPDLKIATIETEWERAKLNGGVIGHVARKMNDTALLALERAMTNGQLPPEQDVLLIRNDADSIGVSRTYLKRFQTEADKHKETDIFQANVVLDVAKARELPGMVAAATFERILRSIQVQREGFVFTEGRSHGVRASTFAGVGAIGFDEYTGASSDDLIVGWRVKAARDSASRAHNQSGYRYGYGTQPAPGDGSKRRIARLVTGAVIDSDAARQEIFYRRDRPMFSEAWAGFDENGYKDRDADLNATSATDDDLKNNPDKVLERIRLNMEATMGGSEASVRSALTFTFVGMKPSSAAGYTLVRRSDGSYSFQFTPEGRQFMLNRLTRDFKGRFDPYGSRKMRRLYNQVSAESKRKPTATQPQLIRVT